MNCDWSMRMASRYWREMDLSSWAPRAKMRPDEREAEKGGWDHLWGSAGTESRWELKRREGREGFEPGQVRRRRGLDLEGEKWRILVVRLRSLDWDWRKEIAEA